MTTASEELQQMLGHALPPRLIPEVEARLEQLRKEEQILVEVLAALTSESPQMVVEKEPETRKETEAKPRSKPRRKRRPKARSMALIRDELSRTPQTSAELAKKIGMAQSTVKGIIKEMDDVRRRPDLQTGQSIVYGLVTEAITGEEQTSADQPTEVLQLTTQRPLTADERRRVENGELEVAYVSQEDMAS